MTRKERILRIVARGEISNHSHVVIGNDVTIEKKEETVVINVGETGAVLRHILESNWVEKEEEIWTEEHEDIVLERGKYEYVQQKEYNPYEDKLLEVKD